MNYLQSGHPIKLDKEISYKLGKQGIELIEKGKFGKTFTIHYSEKKFYLKETPLLKFIGHWRQMDNTFFNKKMMQPTSKYFKYLKTLLDGYDFIDENYQRLQKIISKK
jgi:hypothetical protein